ncbi:hypothetical protein LJC48_03520 [Desulfovibrio sp. OttesenSCG-928-C06]|nr:hypothetical protein [Desulfovibrio sp. OttesenSCG-928-C06]
MKTDKLICVPELHGELFPCPAPAGTAFINPGLAGQKTAGYETFTPVTLPYSPAEAASVLREMLELGSTLGPKMLKDGSLAMQTRELDPERAARRDEKNALAEFAASGTTSAPAARITKTVADNLYTCQKVLLLAWELERNLLEIRATENALAEKDRMLLAALGSSAEFDEAPELAGMQQPREDSVHISMPWKQVLEAAAAFLPEETAMLSFRPEIYEELEENGLLKPLDNALKSSIPAAIAEFERPELAGFGLRCCTAPLWKMLGYSAPDERLAVEKPWLGQTYHLLVATSCPC